jgi:F-type H+-transporting ATPase subunit delta
MAGADLENPVARVYAESLIRLAAEDRREDEVRDELEALAGVVDSAPALARFLESPLVEDQAKRATLEDALRGRVSDLVVDGLQVMRRKGRLGLLRAVAHAYRELWIERRNRVEVRVTSAVALSDELRARLVQALARRTGREPMLVERVDPELLGGLVVSIGDDKIDSSVATRLERMHGDLLARASRELLEEKSYVTDTD